jgi:Mrp family chromosome partitioning ATPase/NifU-like protein involved in Fe-S cluster formation
MKNNHQNHTQQRIISGSAEAHNHIQHVIAVLSGKGGVGKSFVTGILASGLARMGYDVGVMDADITGPSIPMLFGLHGPVEVGDFGILPLVSQSGIKVISMNLLLPNEDQPVIWRGPMVSKGIKQLWGDVMWGDLDYLLIDLPPGTSDATLTIMQSLPVSGLIMVTTPQSLSSLVVRKAVNMAHIIKVKIIGIIENMAFYDCPDTGKRHLIFGPSHSDEIATAADAPLLAQIPMNPDISKQCDEGNVEMITFVGLSELVDRFTTMVPIEAEPKRADNEILDHLKEVDTLLASPHQEDRIVEREHSPELSEYGLVAQQIILSRENMGSFDQPDLHGKVRGCCGDSIQIELVVDGEVIKDARFLTDGCAATIACGGLLTRLIKGKTLTEAQELSPETLIKELGGLPKDHVHCASLAVKTLREIIK